MFSVVANEIQHCVMCLKSVYSFLPSLCTIIDTFLVRESIFKLVELIRSRQVGSWSAGCYHKLGEGN